MGYPQQTDLCPRVVGSSNAVRTLAQMCRDVGPQVILLRGPCAAVHVARTMPRREFVPREYQERIGQVADCSVYADLRHIVRCPHEVIVLELGWQVGNADGETSFVTRPESLAEREQRVFSERSRGGAY